MYSNNTKKLFLSITIVVMLVQPVMAFTGSHRVTVGILSKTARLIKEGALDSIHIRFTEPVPVLNRTSGNDIWTQDCMIRFQHGTWTVTAGSRTFDAPFHFSINRHGNISVFHTEISRQERTYPLPLDITSADNTIAITITEELDRYAVDSAHAEYGNLNAAEREARAVLAHIIRARYFAHRHNPVHKNHDFCDLTHCQIYRGRSVTGPVFTDGLEIDMKNVRGSLFFHSRCGGRTLGNCVFNRERSNQQGIKDILYRFNHVLCGENDKWTRTMTLTELDDIFYPENHKKIQYLEYNNCTVSLITTRGTSVLPPETFRLKINRLRGWNYIRSNNYRISITGNDGDERIRFSGRGLGHGAGLCQHGALELARRGYNRYEILYHYYPGIRFANTVNTIYTTPNLSYCIFDVKSGRIYHSISPNLESRIIPPGSLFKLLVTIYLANRRQDIFNSYQYNCRGHERNIPSIKHCWYLKGHGNLKLDDALAYSCNLYFGSLYRKIDYADFKAYTDILFKQLGISMELPESVTGEEWALILSGLDFKLNISVRELITLMRALAENNICIKGDKRTRELVSWTSWNRIINSLKKTMHQGTVSGNVRSYGVPENYMPLQSGLYSSVDKNLFHELWGKTSTVIDGTNKPEGYGIFTGINNEIGIVTVLRKGNGHLAGKWAMYLLHDYLSNADVSLH